MFFNDLYRLVAKDYHNISVEGIRHNLPNVFKDRRCRSHTLSGILEHRECFMIQENHTFVRLCEILVTSRMEIQHAHV